MSFHVFHNPFFLKHKAPYQHPERPERLTAIESRINSKLFPNVLFSESSRLAGPDEIALIHAPSLIEAVANTALQPFTQLDEDTYACAESYQASQMAIGQLFDGIDVMTPKTNTRALCLVRPPGHHAEVDRAMGFCLFNNVAVAAQYAQKHKAFRKIAIYDFDVHHGNGTQHIFYERPDILYLSHHQFPYYPGTGNWNDVGRGDGIGTTINCPLPAGAGDSEVCFAWDRIFQPVLTQFAPDLLLVSAGFDIHERDPLAQLKVTNEGFRALFNRIEGFATEARVPTLYTLEGGYDLQALEDTVQLAIKAHDPQSASEMKVPPTALCEELAEQARKHFTPFWEL